MDIKTYVVDDFYDNVDDVRNFALEQSFDQKGNYPGARTKSFSTDSTKATIECIVSPLHGPITYWSDQGYNAAFQITTAKDRSWIHYDGGTQWAGVLYLTPDAPLSGGTGFYKHKATGLLEPATPGEDAAWDNQAQDVTKWELASSIGNVYNRLILYKGSLFHTSMDYFGNDLYTGRLFQTFFFNTQR
jgi:hypothetical protein